MNIDDLTLGQIKQLQSLLGGASAPAIEEGRVVLVIDRGWIFAGDQSLTSDGFVRLDNAIHVLRWEKIGFAGMIDDPGSDKVTLKKMSEPVEVPSGSIIHRVPVDNDWGV